VHKTVRCHRWGSIVLQWLKSLKKRPCDITLELQENLWSIKGLSSSRRLGDLGVAGYPGVCTWIG
jgi:hypothetical protein